MNFQGKTFIFTSIQYFVLLAISITYAFVRFGTAVGIRAVLCSVLCLGSSLLVYAVMRNKNAAFFYWYITATLATWYLGMLLQLTKYMCIVFLIIALLIASNEKHKYSIGYLLCTDAILLLNGILNWRVYTDDGTVLIYLLIFISYNFASTTLIFYGLCLQKRIEVLEEKTREAVNSSESKGAFLANMSHEIRTPMNAILGLNQLVLQENISDSVREKAFGIQTACSDLLTIINDILDFSKIESGKIEIIEAEYNTKEMLNDLINLIYLRAEKKIDVDFLVDCDVTLPKRLYGDEVRLKQVIMNLLTNAVKFTSKGYVKLTVNWSLKENDVMLEVSVEDTGIGMKENEIPRVFGSFEQLDPQKNRKVEGTGLGLAISKQLVELMNGSISVQSEYGKGSRFTIRVPQKLVSIKSFVHIEPDANIKIMAYAESDVFESHYRKMFAQLQISFVYTTSFSTLKEYASKGEMTHYFISDACYYQQEAFFEQLSLQKEVVILQNRSSNIKVKDAIKTLYRPFYVVPLEAILNGKRSYGIFSKDDVWDFEYVAPKAKILVVDDNDVNLKVTVGLMRPLNMNIVTANSGQKAIDTIREERFDLVFMDHMMPEMDGVETTKKIRELSEEKWDYYDTVPIIALTANAIGGAREMFLNNGFQDFLAKPMEIRDLDRVLRKWLPKDYLEIKAQNPKEREKKTDSTLTGFEDAQAENAKNTQEKDSWPEEIPGLNLLVAKHFFQQDVSLFYEILSSFFNAGIEREEQLMSSYSEENWSRYQIEAHSIKSASKSIGAMELAELAAELEEAAKTKNVEVIREKHNTFLQRLHALLENIKGYVKIEENEDDLPLIRMKELRKRLGELEKCLKICSGMEDNSELSLEKKDVENDTLNDAVKIVEQLEQFRFSRENLKKQILEIGDLLKEKDIRTALEETEQMIQDIS